MRFEKPVTLREYYSFEEGAVHTCDFHGVIEILPSTGNYARITHSGGIVVDYALHAMIAFEVLNEIP